MVPNVSKLGANGLQNPKRVITSFYLESVVTGRYKLKDNRYIYPFIHSFTIIYSSIQRSDGTPLQYSCLENPMDGGAWQAAVHGVAKSRTRLRDFTFTFMLWRRKWQPTPVFLPGESQGRGCLMGCRLQGHTQSDTTEATQHSSIYPSSSHSFTHHLPFWECSGGQ